MSIARVRLCGRVVLAMACLSTAVLGAGRTIHVPEDQPTLQGAIDAAARRRRGPRGAGMYGERIKINGKNITLASRFLTSHDPADIERTILDGGTPDGKPGDPILVVEKNKGAGTRASSASRFVIPTMR